MGVRLVTIFLVELRAFAKSEDIFIWFFVFSAKCYDEEQVQRRSECNVRNDLKIIESKRPTTMTINSGNDCSINDVQTWFTAQLGRPQQMHAPLRSSNACEPTSTVTQDVQRHELTSALAIQNLISRLTFSVC